MSAITLKAARATLASAKANVSAAVGRIDGHNVSIGRERVLIGIEYVLVQKALEVQPSVYDGSWRDWADAHYKGGPDVYRLHNAGTVALVLGDSIAEATERHLAPLYRILKKAEKGSDDEKAKAIEKVRSVWKSLNARRKAGDPMPSEEKILAAVDKATGTSGGTRGKAAETTETTDSDGKSETTRKSTRKGRKKAAAKVEEVVPESLGKDLSEAELRTLGQKVRTAVSHVATEDLGTYLNQSIGVAKWCEMYGSEAVQAAIRTEVRDTKAARKAAA